MPGFVVPQPWKGALHSVKKYLLKILKIFNNQLSYGIMNVSILPCYRKEGGGHV